MVRALSVMYDLRLAYGPPGTKIFQERDKRLYCSPRMQRMSQVQFFFF